MRTALTGSGWGRAWICFTVIWLLFVLWIAFEDTLGYGADVDGEDLLGLLLNAILPPLILLALGYGIRALRR